MLRTNLLQLTASMKSEQIKTEEALSEMLALLKESHLPFEDVKLDGNLFVGYYDESDHLIASAGLELFGKAALLRSVAVKEDLRGKSLGSKIVKDILERATASHTKEVYLLTETAHDFFLSKGFIDISRDQVPDRIKQSTEFSSVCPVSAACMIYKFGK